MSAIPVIHPYSMPVLSQLPENRVNWKIDPTRAVLLVHDMQHYFVRSIPSSDPKPALLKNSALILERCRSVGIPVAYTLQPGNMTEYQRGLLKDFWGPGMKTTPEDREIVDELRACTNDWLFTKWRYSAFYQSDLLQRMRDDRRDQLVICGVYAHIGILTTALDAFSHDMEAFLIADAVAAFSHENHLMALQLAAACCAMIIPTDKVVFV